MTQSISSALLLLPMLGLTLAPAPSLHAEDCPQTPERLLVLGDSIVDCYNVGGPDGEDCSPRIFHEDLEATWASDVTYENYSVGGAVTASVLNRQIPLVETGPGHALVLIFVGGNDISPYLFMPDSVVESSFPRTMERLEENWAEIFEFFEDPTNFPDGTTIIVNTQYNPFDDCYGTSDTKIALLSEYNDLILSLSEDRNDAYTADPFTPFLGHGHNYKRNTCPYFERDADYWMSDLIHPNEAGHGDLARMWGEMADGFYAVCQ